MSNPGKRSHRRASWHRGVVAAGLGAGLIGLALPQSHLFASSGAPLPGLRANGSAMLVSGRLVTPAGQQSGLGNLPMNAVLSPDGIHMLVVNAGARSPEILQVLDASSRKVVQSLPYASPDGVLYGAVYSPDGRQAFVVGTKDNVHTYTVSKTGRLTPGGDVAIGPGDGSVYPYGLAITPDGSLLMTANDIANSVSVIDTSSQLVVASIPVGHYPNTIAVAPDGKHAYVTNWEDATVSVIDVSTVGGAITAKVNNTGNSVGPAQVKGGVIETIGVGNHPAGMVFSPDGKTLYVADANSDAISAIDTTSYTVTKTISVSPYSKAPLSSSPVSLAISRDGQTLFAANAGENAVAVVSLAAGKTVGRVPTAWYPSTVLLSKDGGTMFVTNAKGYGGGPNSSKTAGPNPIRKPGQGPFATPGGYCNCSQLQYTGSYMDGTLSAVPVPDAAQLATYTAQVQKDNRVADPALLQRTAGNPIPVPGGSSPIKHVIYIDKENRTYDQVFGDELGSNVDPSLLLFGRKVTPNLHALGERFGLLDNFYADAEVSADGHDWINGAYASDYNEKMWVQDYSQGAGRPRGYDFEGDTKVNLNPGGYLWDAAHQAGISYRDYGNFIQNYTDAQIKQVKVIPASANCPGPLATGFATYALLKGTALLAGAGLCLPAQTANAVVSPNLAGHVDPKFRGFDGDFREADRVAEWTREFKGFVAGNNLPALELLRFPNDHTSGTRVGKLTPQAYVAENDAAVGQVVDAVSHSSYWKDTLIVITEDDAQNGSDHVDGHRTTSLIISAYNQHGALTVDHTLYDTAAMVRTIELVLGLRPLSQYDAQAMPMWRLMGSKADLTPYTAKASNIPVTQINTAAAPMAAASAHINTQRADSTDPELMNRITWAAVKGANVPYPVHHYSQFVSGSDN